MSELAPEYIAAALALGQVCEEYRKTVGSPAYLVGGAAVAIHTQGTFHSADFDLIVGAEAKFVEILLRHGFVKETGQGKFLNGYYHPAHPQFSWELVSGPLFDGRSDKQRALQIRFNEHSVLVTPAIEDLIADRLGQYAVAAPSDESRKEQAKMLFQVTENIDMDYLKKRVLEEGGDMSLLDTWTRAD